MISLDLTQSRVLLVWHVWLCSWCFLQIRVMHSRVIHGWVYRVDVSLFGMNFSITDDAICLTGSQISSTGVSRVVFGTICVEQGWTNFFII